MQEVEDHACKAVFPGAEGFQPGVSAGSSALVESMAETAEPDLSDGDTVQGGVELPVPAPGRGGGGWCGQMTRGSTRRRHAGRAGLGAEPGDVRGLPTIFAAVRAQRGRAVRT
ncbi:hypothetical protein KRMM14A1004_15790 [Krasilnikovia sp. MM14-A1004]